MSEMVPLYGFGGGGTGATLTVTAPVGCTVTVSKDGKSKTRIVDASGVAVFKGLETGTWTVTITDGIQTSAPQTVTVTADYSAEISFNTIPDFTFTGDFEIVNDEDEPISNSLDNWKIRFLTSGELVFKSLKEANNVIDVFCVGGGAPGFPKSGSSGGGGGAGYTKTGRNVTVVEQETYSIHVGAGGTHTGAYGSDGGTTSAFGITADGGKTPTNTNNGGSGGSGGGGMGADGANGGNGGIDGNNGAGGTGGAGGSGQGTTTREFGETTGFIYAQGGGGWGYSTATPSVPNSGNGGNVWSLASSGIVIIRNAREVS